MARKQAQDFLPVYDFHGVSLERAGTQHAGDCPFCDKESHFYVDKKTGLFDCKVCGTSGNVYNFLHLIYLQHSDNTTRAQLFRLGKSRGIPTEAISSAGIVYDRDNRRYLVPIYNRNSALSNLKAYSLSSQKRFLCNTPAPLVSHLYGSEKLKNSEDTIYFCEGEWDAITLTHHLSTLRSKAKTNSKKSIHYGTVVALPGATSTSVLTTRILPLLVGKKIILLFDNDEAGQKGTEKTATILAQAGITDLHTIKWPKSYPIGYDISDHFTKTKIPPDKVWSQILEWVEPITNDLAHLPKVSHTEHVALDIEPRTKFTQVLADFRNKGVHLSKDLEGGIAIAAACGLSNELPGDPLWFFLCGPSGSGKSLILESTIASESYIYRTTTNYSDLLSGYKGEDEENTTLLHKLINRTFVIKDYTTVLTLPAVDMQQMNGLLRDAYDGSVHRSWGNGKEVILEGFFSILAGVTNKIHTQQNSNLGERFLKYEIAPAQSIDNNRRSVIQALGGGLRSADDINNRKYRQASFSSFVDYTRAQLRKRQHKHSIPEKDLQTIISLSLFTAISRSVVERDRQGAVLYVPSPESGTRLAKQLVKLPQALCSVYGLRRPDARIMEIVRKTAWDTSYSRIRTVSVYLYQCVTPDNKNGLTIKEICEGILLPKTTVRRTLEDMSELNLIVQRATKNTSVGRPEHVYRLTNAYKKLIKDCGFNL